MLYDRKYERESQICIDFSTKDFIVKLQINHYTYAILQVVEDIGTPGYLYSKHILDSRL